jgi:hypothetical protein
MLDIYDDYTDLNIHLHCVQNCIVTLGSGDGVEKFAGLMEVISNVSKL